MQPANNTGYKTLNIPDRLVDSVKQKLGDEYHWKYDEKSNQVYLMEKSNHSEDFFAEFGTEVSGNALEWFNGKLVNRWDD